MSEAAPQLPAEGAAPGGPPARQPSAAVADYRLQHAQAEVQEVVDIICDNMDRVIKRDVRLSELDDRADALKAGASVFESNAAQLKRKYWWKNCKMMVMMGVICAILVVVIVSFWQSLGWGRIGVGMAVLVLWSCLALHV